MMDAANPRRISVARIKAEVAADFDMPVRVLDLPRRDAAYILPRHIAIYLAMRLTDLSSGVIGRLFRRDHTTILHAQRRIARLRGTDAAFDRRLQCIEARLHPPEPMPELQLTFLTGPLFDRHFDRPLASAALKRSEAMPC